MTSTAEARLSQLIERLLAGADAALGAGDTRQAQTMAEDVLTVDPTNERAEALLRRATVPTRTALGQRTLLTVLFSDLVGSTPMAQDLAPEVLREVFQLYRAGAEDAIRRFDGSIFQFLGDGVVASFGYPHTHEDDARRGVLAGLALVKGIAAARQEARQRHGVDIEVRVGIHTGLALVADLEASGTVETGSILGVTPNLAARLQSEARPGMVVISDVTAHLVDADFHLQSLGLRELKGIARPVEVFAVQSERFASERLASDRYKRTPLIGHEEAREALKQAWAKAASGSPGQSLGLVGEAGIGKSRLVAHLRNLALGHGALVLDAACLPYYTNSSLWPVTQLLKAHLTLHDEADDQVRLDILVRHLSDVGLDPSQATPLLAPLLDLNDPAGHPLPELDPTALLAATLATLVQWVAAVAGGRPTLIVIEDVHWADPSTIGFLSQLATAGIPGTLTTMTSRPPLDPSLVTSVSELRVGRLSAEDVRTLAVELPGGQALTKGIIDSIVDRSEGVPLFVEELTRAAVNPVSDDPFPVKLQELLTSRLEAPGVDLPLAQLASTLGTIFDRAALADLVVDPDQLDARLQTLVAEEIIEPVAGTSQYRFLHALLRDAAYETQILGERRQAHGAVARWLEGAAGEPAVVAGHFDMAGEVAEAIPRYLSALQLAQVRGAHEEAVRLATRGLELVEELPAGPEQGMTELGLVMLRGLSVASTRGYAAPEVEDDYRRAVELSESLGTGPEVMPPTIALWSYALVAGDVATARRLSDRLEARLADGSGTWFAPEVASCVGYQELYEGHLVAAQSAFESAMHGYEERPEDQMVSDHWPLPNDPVAVAQSGLAVVQTLRGDVAGGEATGAAAIARAKTVPFPRGPFSVAFVKTYLAWLKLILGDLGGAQRFGLEVTAIGQEHGYAYWTALGSLFHSVVSPNAEAFEAAMGTLRAIGHEAFRASYLSYLATLQADAGSPAAALSTVEDAMRVAEESGERLHEPDLLRQRGLLTLAADPSAVAVAVADLLRSVSMATESGNALASLRSSRALAELSPEYRPGDWRSLLEKALAAFSAETDLDDVTTARLLLERET